MSIRQKFSSSQRLKSKKYIEELFQKGSSFYLHPLKVYYIKAAPEESDLPKIVVSVPKKKFKRAVDRNKIKRQVREAYRKNRPVIFSADNATNLKFLGFVFLSDTALPYKDLEKKLIFILERLRNI